MLAHQVQPGESAASIAQRYTGSASRASELVTANPQKPRNIIGMGAVSEVVFRDLTVGEKLNLPTNWQVAAPAAALSSPPIGVGDPVAESIGMAESYASSGDYDSAVGACLGAAQAALTAEQSLAQQPQISAITNAISNIQPLVDAGGNDADSYSGAIAWANAAQDAVNADSLLNSGGQPSGPTQNQQGTAYTAAVSLDAQLASGGCSGCGDASSALSQATSTFKTQWVDAGNSGMNMSGSAAYAVGPGTLAAMKSTLGNATTYTGGACTDSAGNCLGSGPTPPAPVATVTCSDGSVHTAPYTCPNAPPIPVSAVTCPDGSVHLAGYVCPKKTNWLPWIIGGVGVAAGIGLVVYMQSQKKKQLGPGPAKPATLPASEMFENPRRRRRHARY